MFIYEKKWVYSFVLIGKHDQNFEEYCLEGEGGRRSEQKKMQKSSQGGRAKARRGIWKPGDTIVLRRKEVVRCALSLHSCGSHEPVVSLPRALLYMPDLQGMDWRASKRLPMRLNAYKVGKGAICYFLSPRSSSHV